MSKTSDPMPRAPTFPILGDYAYVDYIGPIGSRGVNPTTHLANISYPVQRAPVTSVVKLLPPDGRKACNEAIAWLFLRAAGVRTPRHAALISIAEAKIVKVLGRRSVPADLCNGGYTFAWASEQLNFKSVQALFAGTQRDERWLKAMCTAEGAAIAAFDEVFQNTDRNCGNILHLSDLAFVPIDHEALFGLQNWLRSDLQESDVESDSLRRLKNGVHASRITRSTYDETRSRIAHFSERHASALRACEDEVRGLLSRIFHEEGDDMASRVLSFVAARAVSTWMAQRLGLLA